MLVPTSERRVDHCTLPSGFNPTTRPYRLVSSGRQLSFIKRTTSGLLPGTSIAASMLPWSRSEADGSPVDDHEYTTPDEIECT